MGPFLAWLTAWWSWAGWVISFPAVCHTNTTVLVSMVMIANPDYSNPLWVQFLIDVAQIVLASFLNVINGEFQRDSHHCTTASS